MLTIREYGAPTALLSRLGRSCHQPDTGYTPADPLAARSAALPTHFGRLHIESKPARGVSVALLPTPAAWIGLDEVRKSGRAFHASCHPRIRFAVRRVHRRNYNVSRKLSARRGPLLTSRARTEGRIDYAAPGAGRRTYLSAVGRLPELSGQYPRGPGSTIDDFRAQHELNVLAPPVRRRGIQRSREIGRFGDELACRERAKRLDTGH